MSTHAVWQYETGKRTTHPRCDALTKVAKVLYYLQEVLLKLDSILVEVPDEGNEPVAHVICLVNE
jgi:hypothetical protein